MFSLTENYPIQTINAPFLNEKRISLSIARLDKIHPVVSGNKAFKLIYFIKEAKEKNYSGIITFGGAYSNHIVSTAFFCKEAGIKSVGIIRGEKPETLSHTLLNCIEYGMELIFTTRLDYSRSSAEKLCKDLHLNTNNCMIIPEGGYHPIGAEGAGKIMDTLARYQATHICTAVGTATTLAGIFSNKNEHQQVIGVPVLKGMKDIPQRMNHLLGDTGNELPLIWDEYHFGGYARYTPELFEFMNNFYMKYKIPTDFVYTSKMLFGVMDKIENNFFPEGSRIICLHTGGLQGNKSLTEGTLVF